MHDALIKVNGSSDYLDAVGWFVDYWVIVRNDGTPVLNGTPEAFEEALRVFVQDRINESKSYKVDQGPDSFDI